MTDTLQDRGTTTSPDLDPKALSRRIANGVLRARLALIWEDLWPRLVWPLGLCVLFIAMSWLGIWTGLSDIARFVLLGGFFCLLLAAIWPVTGFRLPTRAAALARLEQVSGYRNRPIQTLEDTLPDNADEVTRALWSVHRARVMASISVLKAGMPSPGVDRADRFCLRVVLGLLLFVGFFAAGNDRLDRMSSAFRPMAGSIKPQARLDAWVTPPDYTGKPAILLTADSVAALEADGTIRVPQGASLVIRSAAPGGERTEPMSVTATSGTKTTAIAGKTGDPATSGPAPSAPATPGLASVAQAPSEFETVLIAPTEIVVSRGGNQLARWRFSIIPDQPPTIQFVGVPEPQGSGTLKLTYSIADDYGVIAAEAHLEPAPDAFPVTSNSATVRPLVTAPDFPLSLPGGHVKSGQATTFKDLTSHPWAGAKVRITLVAHDEAAQEGRSETRDVTLPAKVFSKPLARALIEQRRILALDANRQPQVNDAFDALLFAPEHFYDQSSMYLGVAKIYRDLKRARSDDDLRAVMDFIWQVAIGIEDGNLSEAEKALRNAEDALQKALDQGASDAEIAKLTQDLREALDKYLRELAEAARKNPQAQRAPSPNQRMIRQQDLNKMLDRIENLAKTGSRDAARQMLSEMQKMLENLQNAQNGDQGDPGQQSEANDALDKLGEMIQRQQQLMDKTHRLDRSDDQDAPPRPGTRRNVPKKPVTPEERQQALKELENGQADLRKSLKELRDKLAQQGLGKDKGPGSKPGPGQNPGKTPGRGQPGQNGEPQSGDEGDDSAFGKAGEAMGNAKDALGDGDTGDAVDAQGRAIDQLREGAKKLVDEMAQQQGPGRRPGMGQTGEMPGDDPLGRPRRNEGPEDSNSVKVPGEIDVQRARRVLEDIRRRLSEPMRPRLELDYLERLLKGE